MGSSANVIAAVAAVVAVFQQSDGARLALALWPVDSALCAWFTTVKRIRRRRTRLTWRERRIVSNYFDNVVADFLKELPKLPGLAKDALLASQIRSQARLCSRSLSGLFIEYLPTIPRQDLEERPTDPVEILLRLLKDQQSAVVLGDPGSGKTLLAALTFARLADAYRSSRGHAVLPLFIRLNTLFARVSSTSDFQTILDDCRNRLAI